MCETVECMNYFIGINIEADPDSMYVVCGPCGNEITNIVPVVP